MEYFDDTNWIVEKYGQKFCNSGGAVGADTVFEEECIKKGIPVLAWGFQGHKTNSKNVKILTKDELAEGWEHVKIANESLKRNIYNLSPYVRNLLARNWFQVKNSDTIFAVGNLTNSFSQVNGGTGWAVQMGIDNKKRVYVFDQNGYNPCWFQDTEVKDVDGNVLFKRFITSKDSEFLPVLTDRFAGIGTREINEHGILAIKKLFG